MNIPEQPADPNEASDDDSARTFSVDEADADRRLDVYLAENIEGWSRSRLQQIIEGGDVLVNDRAAKASYKLHAGDKIDADLTEVPAARFEPENIPLNIIFEDENLAVVNKPAGMVVHPGAGVPNGTLANAIAYHFKIEQSSISVNHAENRVGIVHRLDKDTSGLIVVAKNEQVHEALSEQFRSREVKKNYVALVHGSPRENSGKIDSPIARDRWHRTKMTVAANGRQALSMWRVRQRFEKFALLEVEIMTGRTHQIRVHLASINHPVVGDATYNEGRDNTVADVRIKQKITSMGRFFLHSEKLSFKHPVTGEQMSFAAPLPDELVQLLEELK